jgi:hypothetical protein
LCLVPSIFTRLQTVSKLSPNFSGLEGSKALVAGLAEVIEGPSTKLIASLLADGERCRYLAVIESAW